MIRETATIINVNESKTGKILRNTTITTISHKGEEQYESRQDYQERENLHGG